MATKHAQSHTPSAGSSQENDDAAIQPLTSTPTEEGDTATGTGSPTTTVPIGPVDLDEVIASGDGQPVTVQGPIIVANPDGHEAVISAPGIEVDIDDEGEPVVVPPTEGIIELPSVGQLADAVLSGPLGGLVGTAKGSELEHLRAHLNPDVTYWYVVLGDDTTVDFGPISVDIPGRFDLPGGGQSIIVIDMSDPYVYFGRTCPEVVNIPVSLDLALSSYEGGCGVGVSLHGRIPTDYELATDVDPLFAAHTPEWVVDGELPLGKVSVVGSAYIDTDIDVAGEQVRHALVAEGQLSVGLPGKASSLPLSFSIGNATGGRINSLDVNDVALDEDFWFSGYMGDNIIAGGDCAFVTDFLSGQGDLEVNGRYGRTFDAGGISFDPESFIEITGQASFNPGALWSAVGDGLVASGHISRSPAVALKGGGDLSISNEGVFVSGRLASPVGGIALEGQISEAGVQLTGSTELSLPIGDLDKVADALARQTAVFRGAQALIDDALDKIERNDAKIAAHRRRLAEIDRNWASYNLLQKGQYGLEATGIHTAIGGLNTANFTHARVRDAQSLVISGVQSTVSGITAREHPRFLETLGLLAELRTRQFTSG
jgi:hypothetical protein